MDVTALRGLIAAATRFDPAFFITRSAMTAGIDAFQRLAEVPAEGKGDLAGVPRVPDSRLNLLEIEIAMRPVGIEDVPDS